MDMKAKDTSTATLGLYQQYPARLLQVIDGVMERSSHLHKQFLKQQEAWLGIFNRLMGKRAESETKETKAKAVFNRKQLEAFASGSIVQCFGVDFAALDKRKSPRIPNGRLLLMDRVVEVSGRRMDILPPASITTEADIERDAWFLENNPYGQVPLAVLMEIALQPCGMLSAYLGTPLIIPAENNLFRNLDGWMTLAPFPDLRGKTITSKSQLIKTIASGGLYIQQFKFQLLADDHPFANGESSFGYFTQAMMEQQHGLDGDNKKPMLISSGEEVLHSFEPKIHNRAGLKESPLDLWDQLWISTSGGDSGLGAFAGMRTVQQNDWFFSNHFYQDPVMPGSLGVEAITRGLAVLAGRISNDAPISPELDLAYDQPLRWKYRGQVLPTNQQTYFEGQVKERRDVNGTTRVSADANFWADGIRIYSVENLSMILKEKL